MKMLSMQRPRAAAPPVHADAHVRRLEPGRVQPAGEVATLVVVDDARREAPIQGVHHESHLQGGRLLQPAAGTLPSTIGGVRLLSRRPRKSFHIKREWSKRTGKRHAESTGIEWEKLPERRQTINE